MDDEVDYIECESCGELVPNLDVFIGSEIFLSENSGKWFCKHCYKDGAYEDDDDYE